MTIGRRPCRGLVCAFVLATIVAASAGTVAAQVRPDSLELQQPRNVRVWREFNPVERAFKVFMTWEDVPDSLGTYIHPPDTTGWATVHFSNEMSVPTSSGIYTGDIDRTISFRAIDSGQVGVDQRIRISFEIRKEENFNGEINVGAGAGYVPGTPVPLIFRDENDAAVRMDLGIRIAFSAGWVDRQGGFLLGVEDFEGYHIWRGIRSDGSDLEVIGELSKEEAHRGDQTGGSVADSVYYYSVIPTLRDSLTWYSQFGGIDCLGRQIRLDLTDTQLFWYDCNTFNGFTYYYVVTTFDRDYVVQAGRQGLNKFDNCQPEEGIPFPCPDQMHPLSIEVDAQNDINRVYAVPNPYRTGGSRLTRANYHNFPDNKVRFVNVPPDARIKIYTVAGDLVWEGAHTDGTGNIEWDAHNGNSEAVASGVYIYKVEASNGDTVYGRLVVIR